MSVLLKHRAVAARLVQGLQARHVARLEAASAALGHPLAFTPVSWQRDGGRHGGGTRMQTLDSAVFSRASVNVSVVHYDDQPDRALSAACALSAIVHPAHPHAPSMHLHVSWTARKDGAAYWRVMADLNPAIPDPAQTEAFRGALAQAAGPWWPSGSAQGDRYFAIPALDRTRGVAHFYLEGFDSGDFDADAERAQAIEAAAIDTYGDLVEQAVAAHPVVTAADRAAQRAYHTAYLFQVLTLDRGTTSGLMVHGDNDVGILGSLPATVDRGLLATWADRVDPRQRPLVAALVAALPDAHPSPVDIPAKRRLADAVRAFYQRNPAALDLQARGDVLPPTVDNHR